MPTAHLTFPRLHQAQRTIYSQLARLNVLRCGRRFGKTVLLETTFGRRAVNGDKIGWFTPDYKLMRPTYTRMNRMLAPIVTHSSKTESIINLKGGGLIEFWSLDNEDAGRSRDYDHVVIDEASLVRRGLQEIVEQAIAPTLLDRNGTLTLAGTPKGIDAENFFYRACVDKELGYKEFHLPTEMNPLLNREALAKLPERYPPLVYQQEYLALFVDWSGVAFFPRDKMLYNGDPVEFPAYCDTVFAVIDSATKTGKENDGTAVLYCAYNSRAAPGACALYWLDYDIQQIEGALLEIWLPSVFRRLEELAALCKARMGSAGAFIEDKASGMILLQQARRKGLKVKAIDSKLTSLGKSERAINTSGYYHREMCKVTRHAFNKVISYKGVTQNHFIMQMVSFRVGSKEDQQDDLLDCGTYSMALALGNAEGF